MQQFQTLFCTKLNFKFHFPQNFKSSSMFVYVCEIERVREGEREKDVKRERERERHCKSFVRVSQFTLIESSPFTPEW